MRVNQWTLGLVAAGVVSAASVSRGEEAPSQVLTALSSTTLSGYVDTSAIWKIGSDHGKGSFIPGRSFDNAGKMDGFNLNVVKLILEKPLDEGQWSAGYRVDLLFGPDAVGFNSSANLLTGIDSDFALKQAYVALRAPVGNGIDLKIGTFDTIVGYEVFESPNNPNYSRSFGWALEPTQHTGLLASYHINDMFSVSAGVANTYSAGINLRSPRAESHKTYMASISMTLPESAGMLKGSAFYAGVIDGFAGNALEDTTLAYVGGSVATPVEGLAVGAAFDYRFNGPSAIPAGFVPPNSWAYAVALYTSFQASEKLKFNGRLDYTTGTDGTWYDAGILGTPDKQNEMFSATLTADYALWANVITRAEVRWDHSLRGDHPYGDGDRNAITLAANIIYKF